MRPPLPRWRSCRRALAALLIAPGLLGATAVLAAGTETAATHAPVTGAAATHAVVTQDASTSAAAGAASQGVAPVRAQQAWIRWLPANLPAGGYVTLTNASDQALALVSASSPDYGSVGLHRTINRNGTSRMVPVARIDLAPHATVNFAAFGYHLMLMQPRVPVVPGDHVPVTLHFADGRSLTASFEVLKPSATAPSAASAKGVAGMPNMPGMKH